MFLLEEFLQCRKIWNINDSNFLNCYDYLRILNTGKNYGTVRGWCYGSRQNKLKAYYDIKIYRLNEKVYLLIVVIHT